MDKVVNDLLTHSPNLINIDKLVDSTEKLAKHEVFAELYDNLVSVWSERRRKYPNMDTFEQGYSKAMEDVRVMIGKVAEKQTGVKS